ncbi:hypothetical protein QR685DRAFT_572089 [Neurospora intermedia]|uniref:Uncharacterized protein n=1 Tax=Neurospora intermedia TaxID=5142 RepID=A0ABR3DEH6_NEUIN
MSSLPNSHRIPLKLAVLREGARHRPGREFGPNSGSLEIENVQVSFSFSLGLHFLPCSVRSGQQQMNSVPNSQHSHFDFHEPYTGAELEVNSSAQTMSSFQSATTKQGTRGSPTQIAEGFQLECRISNVVFNPVMNNTVCWTYRRLSARLPLILPP